MEGKTIFWVKVAAFISEKSNTKVSNEQCCIRWTRCINPELSTKYKPIGAVWTEEEVRV